MLTSRQIACFHDDGFLLMRSVLSHDELNSMREAADRMADDAVARLNEPAYARACRRHRPDWVDHPETHYVYAEDGAGLRFHRVEWMWEKDPVFRHVSVHPRVLEAVGQLLERPFWPRGGALVYKMPGGGQAVPWHQDVPYFWRTSLGQAERPRRETFPTPNFTTDFYLEASRGDNGGVWATPGSHQQGSVDVDRLVAEHGFRLPGAVPLEAEAGDVLLHHVAVVHGSDTNTSPDLRRTFYQHYLSEDVVDDAYGDWPTMWPGDISLDFWQEAVSGRRARGLSSDGQAALSHKGFALH